MWTRLWLLGLQFLICLTTIRCDSGAAIVKRQAVKGDPGCFKEKAGNHGTITSPNYPNKYPDSIDCYTEITLYGYEFVSFKFDNVELEYEENCTSDYVEIFDTLIQDSEHSLGRYCTDPGKYFQSTGNTMLIHFHSDQVINAKGFSGNYSVQKLNTTVDCYKKVSKPSGYVESPNIAKYGMIYPNSVDCYTEIVLPPGKRIFLRFEILEVEYDDDCAFDFVEIFDGPSKKSKSLGKYCDWPAKTFNSSGNTLLIHFHSDADVNYNGYRAVYSDKDLDIQKIDHIFDHFLEYPRKQTVPEGSTHEMSCIPKDPTITWTWYKDGKNILKHPLPHLKVEDDVLTIESMNPSLIGEYSCKIKLDGKPFVVKAFINMSKDTSCNFDIKRFDRITTKEGRYTRLECVTTSEFLKISWRKNGHPVNNGSRNFLFGSGKLLVIDGILHEDRGNYTCVARDPVTNCEKRETVEVVVFKKSEICGIPKVGRPDLSKPTVAGGKVVGGTTAEKGAFPWQAMLWDTTKNLSVCGGSLISKKWVLSAAHCIQLSSTPISKIDVYLGKHDVAELEKDQQGRRIKRAEVHPSYSRTTHDNDVALLEMDKSVKFTDYVIPICLGDPDVIENSIFKWTSYKGTVTGWGRIIEGGAQARFLKEVRLPMVTQKECWKSTKLTVTRNMFCAGYSQETAGEGKDACEGDSGGPFGVEFRSRWYVVGVVSWSEGVGACARKGKYGFYAKVNNYHTWIDGITGEI